MDPHPAQDTYDVEAASRLSRLGATFIDGLVGLAPLAALFLMVPMVMLSGGAGTMLVFLALAGLIAIVVVVTQIVLLAKHGQTIGKKVLGIRMITSDGDIPSVWRVFFRRWLPFVAVAAALDLVLKLKGIGNVVHLVDVLLIFQANRRCLHDLFADTHVIKA
jgi:uncharacterized RDD family membrane protein YckC